jgi:hypothetical protein
MQIRFQEADQEVRYTSIRKFEFALIVLLVAADTSNITYLEPEHFSRYGSERVVIKFGPYEIPPNSVTQGILHMENRDSTPPCQDCLITWLQVDLTYPNGTSADANTGLWLQCANLTNAAKDDPLGCLPLGEPFFAMGNEYTTVDFSSNG